MLIQDRGSPRVPSSEPSIDSGYAARQGSNSGSGSAIATATALERELADWHLALERIQQRYLEPQKISFGVRVFECAVAILALIFAVPILLILVIMIRRDSPGNAVFRQERVGSGGRLFRFTKLRTLYVDAKERFPHLYAYLYTPRQIEELSFKVPNDPRVTRVGKWLRRSTLDELPNFWHVLTGEMALVGPRPEIPEMLPYYTDEELVKFSIRPGITGYAQISGRGRLRFRETAKLDVDYVRERSFWIDLRVIWRTLYLIIRGDGAF